ncbi:hypothetical protein VTL71DRAFT_2039 [Oculimacula yallundae]|uniref:Uncharacterized protein n=1 Tax=Oculimacula yallundae TaxID=86028 RepID=A0ABR4CCD5_9HELO
MSSATPINPATGAPSSPGGDGKARSGTFNPSLPTSSSLRAPAGGLLRGATDDNGQLSKAALLVGIKLDLEAEVHLTARVRGDITIGLY